MELKVWSPFLDLDKEFRFDFPRILREAGGFRPSIDLVKAEGQLTLTVELPGMKAEAVDVSLEGGILTIKGEKNEEKELSDDDRYMHERSYGSFQRRIAMPDGVTEDSIAADFENGVLTVRVALPEERAQEPRRIPVGAKT